MTTRKPRDLGPVLLLSVLVTLMLLIFRDQWVPFLFEKPKGKQEVGHAKSPQPMLRPENNKLYLQKVNKHLVETYVNMEHQQLREKLALERTAPLPSMIRNSEDELSKLEPKKEDEKKLPSFDSFTNKSAAKGMTEREPAIRLFSNSDLEEKLRQDMAEDLKHQLRQEAYKKEYAEAFIANARKEGIEVILDENYNVIRARKIKPKKQMNLFAPE